MKDLKFKNIFIAFLTAIALFFLSNKTIVSALIPSSDPVPEMAYETEVKTGPNGFSQIVIKDQNGEVTFLTDENLTHANPVIDGDSVAWMAQTNAGWQIFHHQISTGKTTQITGSGNNVNPQISGKNIAWEGFKDGVWQIFLFDGLKITQLTQGEQPKQDLTLDGSQLAFSQKEDSGWQIYLYNIETKNLTKISQDKDLNNRKPLFRNQKVYWQSADNNEVSSFEYNPSDHSTVKMAAGKGFENSGRAPETTTASNQEEKNSQTVEPQSEVTVTTEEIKNELGITDEINNLEETPESTASQQNEEPPSPQDLNQVQESTASSN